MFSIFDVAGDVQFLLLALGLAGTAPVSFNQYPKRSKISYKNTGL